MSERDIEAIIGKNPKTDSGNPSQGVRRKRVEIQTPNAQIDCETDHEDPNSFHPEDFYEQDSQYRARYERIDSSKYDQDRDNRYESKQYHQRGRSTDREEEYEVVNDEDDISSNDSRYEDDYYSLAAKKKNREKRLRVRNNNATVIQLRTSNQPQFMRSTEMIKFNGDGEISWEEFERQVRNRTKGLAGHIRADLLQSAFGPRVIGWYNINPDLWKHSFEDQLTALRQNYSRKRGARGIIGMPRHISMKANEEIDDFVQRIVRSCIHLEPSPFRKKAGEDEHDEKLRRLEHYTCNKLYERVTRDMFVQGLPLNLQRRVRAKKEQMKTLKDAIEFVKDLQEDENDMIGCDLYNKQQQVTMFQHDRAATYHSQTVESDEDEDAFVAVTQTAARGNNNPKAVDQLQTRVAEVEQKMQQQKLSQGENRKVLQTLVAKVGELGTEISDNLPEKMKRMLTEDTKPTAKAGTKGDPTLEQVEEQRSKAPKNKRQCITCGKIGHWTEDCYKNTRPPKKANNARGQYTAPVPAAVNGNMQGAPNYIIPDGYNYPGNPYPPMPMGQVGYPVQNPNPPFIPNPQYNASPGQTGYNQNPAANNAGQNGYENGQPNQQNGNNRGRNGGRGRGGNRNAGNRGQGRNNQAGSNGQEPGANTVPVPIMDLKEQADAWNDLKTATENVKANMVAVAQLLDSRVPKN